MRGAARRGHGLKRSAPVDPVRSTSPTSPPQRRSSLRRTAVSCSQGSAGEPLVAVRCGSHAGLSSDVVEIKRLWVDSVARGLGIGRSLLAALESAAAELDCRTVRLDTATYLIESLALYQSPDTAKSMPTTTTPTPRIGSRTSALTGRETEEDGGRLGAMTPAGSAFQRAPFHDSADVARTNFSLSLGSPIRRRRRGDQRSPPPDGRCHGTDRLRAGAVQPPAEARPLVVRPAHAPEHLIREVRRPRPACLSTDRRSHVDVAQLRTLA